MYAYLAGASFWLLLWCIAFASSPKLRPALLWSSLLWGFAGPMSEFWHRQDYWQPDYFASFQIGEWIFGLEDYLFAFAFTGTCVWIFAALIPERYQPSKYEVRLHNLWKMAAVLPLSLITLDLFTRLTGMNSIAAIVIFLVSGSMIILFQKPHWISAASCAGLFIGLLFFLFYWCFFFRIFPHTLAWWNIETLSGIALAGVPVEEIVWACAGGFFAGPVVLFLTELNSYERNVV